MVYDAKITCHDAKVSHQLLDRVQRFPLNFSPYIPLTCHVSVLSPPISSRSTAVPLYQTSIPHHIHKILFPIPIYHPL
jgi:hypothetical protein